VADVMSPEMRSAVMSRIRSKNTGIERLVFRELRARGVYFSRHVAALPGKPDVVFKKLKVAVFIDGDFWHGWRFPRWCAKLQPYWKARIMTNRIRDQRNFRRLRRNGWTVIRVWEHNVEANPLAAVALILRRRRAAAVASLKQLRSSRNAR
jgi:DNA mismatch endonuclease (patch repair protein)